MKLGRDGIAGLVCLVVGAGLMVASLGLQRSPLVPIGPAFYPRIIFGALVLLGGMLFLQDLWRRRRGPPESTAPPGPRRDYGLVALTFALFGIYALALNWLGYRIATLLFVVALAGTLDRPRTAARWAVIFVVAAVTAFSTHWVFEGELSVLLPRGRWTGY